MNEQIVRDLLLKINNNGTHYIYQRNNKEYTIVSREKKLELILYYDASASDFLRLDFTNLEKAKGKYKTFLIWKEVIICQYLKKKKEYY